MVLKNNLLIYAVLATIIVTFSCTAEKTGSDSQLGVTSLNDFSLSFHKKLVSNSNDNDNVVSSPLSVYTAFSALTLGATGETRKEMKKALKWRNVRSFVPSLRKFFQSLIEGNKELVMANKMFIAPNFQLRQNYVRRVKKYFRMKSQNMDFSQAEKSRNTINSWVKKKTNNLIPELFPAGKINSLTRMVLANVIHFKSAWKKPFKSFNTRKYNFESPSGPVKVDFMKQTQFFHMAATKNARVLELPYKGNKLGMFFFVPNEKVSVQALEKAMTVQKIQNVVSTMSEDTPSWLKVVIPKFDVDFEIELNEDVMNMKKVFSREEAELKKLSNEEGLYVSYATHKTVLKVDEAGTEAAAATGFTLEGRSMTPYFFVNRPFLFYIVHKESGAILFSGRIMNPKK